MGATEKISRFIVDTNYEDIPRDVCALRFFHDVIFSEPATPYQAKYRMPYCIAAAVVDHQVTLETFTDQ